MKLTRFVSLALIGSSLFCVDGHGQTLLKNDFSDVNEKINQTGRGTCSIQHGVFRTKDAYASFGDVTWKNYSVSFKARAPKNAEMVQIWAGFRAGNRFDRYVLGVKGGLQDDLYLMRLGYMGMDEIMAVRPLEFHPVPGDWYKFKVAVCGDRIRVFVNDEVLPYIDLEDKNSFLASAGQVTLGGGWIETEFDDLEISPLEDDAFKGIPSTEFKKMLSATDKEQKRESERKAYSSIKVKSLDEARTDISLDGKWLFMPEYQMKDVAKAVSSDTDDNNWHVMTVPSFWTPIRIWLHGETMPSPKGSLSKGVSDTYYQQETKRCENYTFDYKKTSSAWYRQWIELPENLKGKKSILTFDAIAKSANIYVNGSLVKSNLGMFGEIAVDVSQYLHPGKNLVAVKVVRQLESENVDTNKAYDFFYSSVREGDKEDPKTISNKFQNSVAHGFYGDNPGGIWQPVKLTITNNVRIDDVFIKPNLSGASIDLTIKNEGPQLKKMMLYTDIIDKETGSLLFSDKTLSNLTIAANGENTFTFDVKDLKPRLWSPEHPNLYDFRFRIEDAKHTVFDCMTELSGFRTFESKDGFFYLNGKRFWFRGGNHIPFALAPNDVNLANTFMQLMRAGNINSTRTHTTPWNKLWMTAADRNGIGISCEGTWPWLMIHATPIPEKQYLDKWKEEYLSLIKKYRNHPSLLFWTINNEMKFYHLDSDLERCKQKMQIISDVIKEMRKIDPTRPICFDSNYIHKGMDKKFGEAFMASIDDGDIDDQHAYYNWYNPSFFNQFNGEFQRDCKTVGRPLISQEMATGYPNNETGHPTRSYQLMHQTPQSLVGYDSYDFANPETFLSVQSTITGELAEALRRTNDQASGFMHFALLTWFRQVYDYKNIEPYPTYFALKRAFQPVLVSAELWGRNLYAGEKLYTRIYVANDRENGSTLDASLLRWKIVDAAGNCLKKGSENVPAVKHSGRYYFEPNIELPNVVAQKKQNVKLVLDLYENGIHVSANEYSLLLASREWVKDEVKQDANIVLLANDDFDSTLNHLDLNYHKAKTIEELVKVGKKADLCIVSGLNNCSADEKQMLRSLQKKGTNLLYVNNGENALTKIFPEYINKLIPTKNGGDIIFMERDEHPIFDGLDNIELRYFNNNKREIPQACKSFMKVNRNEDMTEVAGHMMIHGYLSSNVDERFKQINERRGLVIMKVKDGKGNATISTVCVEKADTDPVAGKLLVNMINDLLKIKF